MAGLSGGTHVLACVEHLPRFGQDGPRAPLASPAPGVGDEADVATLPCVILPLRQRVTAVVLRPIHRGARAPRRVHDAEIPVAAVDAWLDSRYQARLIPPLLAGALPEKPRTRVHKCVVEPN